MANQSNAEGPGNGPTLPVINQHVVLRSESDHEYGAWVLEAGLRTITLTRSAPSLDEPFPDPGDAMEVSWPIEGGEQILPVEFIGNHRPDSDLIWDVRPTGPSRHRQRRSYPRVFTFSPARLTPAKGAAIECMLLDANEVALRVRLSTAAPSPITPGSTFEIAFHLGGQDLVAGVSVMRVTPLEGQSTDVVLTVSENAEARERLRAAVTEELSRDNDAPWVG